MYLTTGGVELRAYRMLNIGGTQYRLLLAPTAGSGKFSETSV